MTRLIVWRHGNTDWNAESRFQGQADIPLNERGRGQAADAAEALARLSPAAIVSSDLSRAFETGTALAGRTGLVIRSDQRLRERFFGDWQGLTTAEIRVAHPAEHDRWTAGADDVGCGVETLDDLGKRVSEGFREAVLPGGVVVVATHGGAARQGIGHLLGWSPEQIRTLRGMSNCHWADLRHDESRGWQLAAYNVGVRS